MPTPIAPIESSGSDGVHPDDLAATLDGLDGRYRAGDLYTRYCSAATEAGREPASRVKLSAALKTAGAKRARSTGGTRVYDIHPPTRAATRRTR